MALTSKCTLRKLLIAHPCTYIFRWQLRIWSPSSYRGHKPEPRHAWGSTFEFRYETPWTSSSYTVSSNPMYTLYSNVIRWTIIPWYSEMVYLTPFVKNVEVRWGVHARKWRKRYNPVYYPYLRTRHNLLLMALGTPWCAPCFPSDPTSCRRSTLGVLKHCEKTSTPANIRPSDCIEGNPIPQAHVVGIKRKLLKNTYRIRRRFVSISLRLPLLELFGP